MTRQNSVACPVRAEATPTAAEPHAAARIAPEPSHARVEPAGVCTECGRALSPSSRLLCIGHALRQREAQARRQARVRAAPKPELPRYVPLDYTLGLPRIRILRALRWFDWVRTCDLHDALGVAGPGTNEHDAVCQALSRAVVAGLVERRGPRNVAYYRITEAGRAAARTRVEGYDNTSTEAS